MLDRRNTFNILSSSKTIGFFGGVCLLFNTITGPGIPFTPQLFSVQGSGLIPTLAFFLSVYIISGISVLLIIEAMQAIPGNKYFQGTIEFGTLINFYFGKIAHLFGQILLYGALQSNAIQSIVISAQITDNLVIDLFGKTCGLSNHQGWICVHQKSVLNPSPFQCTSMLFSFGLLFILVLVIPMGFMKFDDNISLQAVSFMIAITIGIQWIVSSILMGWNLDRLSILTPNPRNIGTTVGTIILNMGFTTVVPSWINIKRNEVSVQKVVWTSLTIGILFYITLGIALGFATEPSQSGSVFSYMQSYGIPLVLTRVTISLYTYLMLVTSIPISFKVSYQNLIQNKVSNLYVSLFASFLLPWFFTVPFQAGIGLSAFITWTSAFFVAPANFIVPIGIYISCVKFRRGYNQSRYLSDHQLDLLKTIHWSSQTIGKFIDDSGKETSSYPSRRPGLLRANDQSESSLNIQHPQKSELEQKQESSGYGESNSINIQHAGKDTIRNRTSTRSSIGSRSPHSPCRDNMATDFHKITDLNLKKLENSPNHSSYISNTSQKIPGGLLLVPEEPRISRSLSDRPRTYNTNASANQALSELTNSVSLQIRRASADEYLNIRRSTSVEEDYRQKENNIPEWFYEDVPDPDAEDWGQLKGILSLLNPEKSAQEEAPVSRIEEISEEISTISTLAASSHQFENASSIPLQIIPKDSQQKLLHSETRDGLGYLDDELESIRSRRSSLPANPHYKGPMFRSIPTWIPIRTIYIALFLFLITSGLNLMIVVSSITQWSHMAQCSPESTF